MFAFGLPKIVKRSMRFIWPFLDGGRNLYRGPMSYCLVFFCKLKKCGVPAIKNLLLLNNYLLMKYAFKLRQIPNLPWVQWYHRHYSIAIVKPKVLSIILWKIVNHDLPTLQKKYFVFTNNGLSTFFGMTPGYFLNPHL